MCSISAFAGLIFKERLTTDAVVHVSPLDAHHRAHAKDGSGPEGHARAVLDARRTAGCQRAYVDGSFVTEKADPQDFDGCWEVRGVAPGSLDPELLDFSNGRAAQKAKYGGEMFPAELSADPAGTRFLDYFRWDKTTGKPKGIVALDLGDIP